VVKGPTYEKTSGRDQLNQTVGSLDEYIIGLGVNMWFIKSIIYVFIQNKNY
jgi:hypothetical protein